MFLLLVLICVEGSMALSQLLKPIVTYALSRLPIAGEPRTNLSYHFNFTRTENPASKKKVREYGCPNVRFSVYFSASTCVVQNVHEMFKNFQVLLIEFQSLQVDTLMEMQFDTHDIVSLCLFSTVGFAHVAYRHWITNDIIGLAFSLYGIEMLHLASFKVSATSGNGTSLGVQASSQFQTRSLIWKSRSFTLQDGCLLLSGLFVYDIFWVFATDVMTTVATGINAPILLMFPQDMLRVGAINAVKHSMLGLGDIVIPGAVFLGLDV
jgi:hypothetical protein